MSQKVIVDYEGIAIECESICELAKDKLNELENIAITINDNSTCIANEQTRSILQQILQQKGNLAKQIKTVEDTAQSNACKGKVDMDNMSEEYHQSTQVVDSASQLKDMVDELSSQRIVQYKALVDKLLSTKLQQDYQNLLAQASGKFVLPKDVEIVLDSIRDDMQRQFALMAYIQDKTLRGQDLVVAGTKLIDQSYQDRQKLEIQEIRQKLIAAKIDKEKIQAIINIDKGSAKENIQSIATECNKAIIDEKIRKKSINAIKSVVAKRGFKVTDIKISDNIVNMVAVKANGQKAYFHVYINGKFEYDFKGYRGQACQNDIQPLEKDLEEVYGIHITKKTVKSGNPDKIASMKHNTVRVNKGGI